MASEVIKLNLIPKGEMPVFHCSQFDNGRLINIELYRGEDAYTIPEGCTAELHCRKVDGNIVTIGSPVVDENTIKFTSTTQLTACNGKNLCEVAILGADDYLIGTLNFWLEVEVDPLKGGINSTSEIHDLYEQIEDITAEVIGDDYYDKTEVDTLLDAKADKSTTYTKTQVDTLLTAKADKSNVYTKSEISTLLSAKADADNVYTKAQVETKLAAKADAAAVYTKDETDTLLDAKANANAVYSKVEVDAMVDDLEDAIDLKADAATTYTKTEVDTALALKANAADVYTKTQVDNIILDIMPVDTAGPSAIANFTTGLAIPLVECKVGILATGGNGTPDNPISINGYSEANIVNTQNESIADLFSIDSDFRGTVAFNQLVNKNNFPSTTTINGITFTNNGDGSITASGTASELASFTVLAEGYMTISGHKYYVCGCPSNGSDSTYRLRFTTGNVSETGNGTIFNGGIAKKLSCQVMNGYAISGSLTFKPMLFDLTSMFGSTIADYIHSLEQATTGAGVAFFRSIYPADYYDYDVGTNELVGKIIPNATIAFGQTVYGGVLDVTRGKLHVTHIEPTALNTLTWVKTTIGSYDCFYATLSGGSKKPFPDMSGLCSSYANSADANMSVDNTIRFYGSEQYNFSRCLIRDDSKASLTDDQFKATVTGDIIYELATPFDIDLTPVQIRALVGQNNVFGDTNGDTTVKFKDTIQNYIDKKVST